MRAQFVHTLWYDGTIALTGVQTLQGNNRLSRLKRTGFDITTAVAFALYVATSGSRSPPSRASSSTQHGCPPQRCSAPGSSRPSWCTPAGSGPKESHVGKPHHSTKPAQRRRSHAEKLTPGARRSAVKTPHRRATYSRPSRPSTSAEHDPKVGRRGSTLNDS